MIAPPLFSAVLVAGFAFCLGTIFGFVLAGLLGSRNYEAGYEAGRRAQTAEPPR